MFAVPGAEHIPLLSRRIGQRSSAPRSPFASSTYDAYILTAVQVRNNNIEFFNTLFSNILYKHSNNSIKWFDARRNIVNVNDIAHF